MEVLIHHIYEYEKGLRNLILHTSPKTLKEKIEAKLNKKDIPFVIHEIPGNKINIYFGNKHCIDVVKSIGKVDLSTYSDEEDYILGIMLGYDRVKQCERFLNRKLKKELQSQLIG
ncbi:MAG: DUF2023 family protein [Fusobacteriaceae bacterium]|nr:DUF2023 family protein [Fusobacteriaceae bacterium]